ncbi:hypothetical protein BDV59DRAFT_181103 [Aspergillus ambiguus]|uniref:uncharacterized protein n=1 Tax=Aspergillus ambiguus TaxID=176160 RepID=UPI003CCD610C
MPEMSRKVIFLMGAPTPQSLNWDEDDLLDGPVFPFDGADPTEDLSAVTDTQPVKWRLLSNPEPYRHSLTRAGSAHFLTMDLAHQDDISGAPGATSAESTLFQFYNHSFAVHETSEISAPGAHSATDSVRESGLWTDSVGSSSMGTAQDSEVSEHDVCIRGPVTDLQDIPTAVYLDSIIPQTMTVNLIVGVVTIRPPRRIVTRQWKKELDLVEMVVGDETRSGFGVTFWLPPPEAAAVTGKDNVETKAGHELRRTLATLRPRDIVLLRMVGLSTFRERVYGQSLRKGITTVELLHRQRVDVTDVGGRYSAKRLRLHQGPTAPLSANAEYSGADGGNGAADAKKEDDLPVVKTSKVREWIRRFVDWAPEAAGGERESLQTKRGPILLPPDSQEGL